MAVNPDFIEFVDKYSNKYNILFEGDRLFTLNNLMMLKKHYELNTVIISSIKTNERHIQRGDSQSKTFIKSRITKIQNIIKGIDDYVIHHNNEIGDDKIIYNKLFSLL